MTQKVMAIVQKLSTIYCSARESLTFMLSGLTFDDKVPGVDFRVLPVDVEAAWDLAQQSMHTYKHFKVY